MAAMTPGSFSSFPASLRWAAASSSSSDSFEFQKNDINGSSFPSDIVFSIRGKLYIKILWSDLPQSIMENMMHSGGNGNERKHDDRKKDQ
ncbi:hypothetical protein H6B11_11990 [Mediterraneibacter glycyrrhizinilyticus]|nr:hypothetical protein [Mediterraneibacter glycyrrhizinilyticus]MBM6854862.1 hypothetical protein [Mediterraneibacter glycyrrhizinilyticus]